MIKIVFVFIVLQLLLLIPSYSFYKKFLEKKNVSKNLKTYTIIATLLMPVIYTTLVFGLCYGVADPLVRSKKFDSQDWIKDPDSRYKMVNDLKKTKTLEGKTKQEVIDILGSEYTIDCWSKNTFCYLAYDPENYSPLDHYEFVVFFNDQGRVIRVEHQLI